MITGRQLQVCQKAFTDHVYTYVEFPDELFVPIQSYRYETPKAFPFQAPTAQLIRGQDMRVRVIMPEITELPGIDQASQGSREMRQNYLQQLAQAILPDVGFEVLG